VGTDALDRVMAEYRQWPGLRLTKRQAGRLFWLSSRECEVVFDALVTCGLLQLDSRGQYALRSADRPTIRGSSHASARATRVGHGR
jgi:hypothetical protein